MRFKKVSRKTQSDPVKWMEAGFVEADKSIATFRLTQGYMLRAGYFFMRARAALPPETQIGDFFERFKSRASKSSIYRYIEFTESVFANIAEMSPALAGNRDKLLAAAERIRLQSPKEFVALCRSAGLMRPFGEYDAVKHATKKLKGPEQMEFGFDVVIESAKVLRTFDLDTFFATMPEGADQRQIIGEAVANLRAAEARLSGWLNDFDSDKNDQLKL